MRILTIDIDSLRPDHLGCYGYHRATSPNIDRLAAEGIRFENTYASDTPCLPSRTALWSGRHGFRTGVINHGGAAAQPFVEGAGRGFRDDFDGTGWMRALRQAGYHTVTVSPFGERHAAWHWYAGYNEIYNPGQGGNERADEVAPIALDWLDRRGAADNWFLHVNFWDPHTPYRTPAEAGDPFAEEPLPDWLNENIRLAAMRNHSGMRCAQELNGWGGEDAHLRYPRVPETLDSMDGVRQMIDGYDTGIRYSDYYVGQLVDKLAALGVLDDTAIFVSADHGENQGELKVWGDHQLADQITCRVPLIVRWPGKIDSPRIDSALHYHFDWAATLIELAGGEVPANWDGQSFAAAFQGEDEAGREYLVLSHSTHTCQRAVRWDDTICIRTYHDGYKLLPDVMLFHLAEDPHEQHNLAEARPDLVDKAMGYLADWQHRMMVSSGSDVDPMMTVLREGRPFHAQVDLPAYLERLRASGREHVADALAAKYPGDL